MFLFSLLGNSNALFLSMITLFWTGLKLWSFQITLKDQIVHTRLSKMKPNPKSLKQSVYPAIAIYLAFLRLIKHSFILKSFCMPFYEISVAQQLNGLQKWFEVFIRALREFVFDFNSFLSLLRRNSTEPSQSSQKVLKALEYRF